MGPRKFKTRPIVKKEDDLTKILRLLKQGNDFEALEVALASFDISIISTS